jgi:hypothetical protein
LISDPALGIPKISRVRPTLRHLDATRKRGWPGSRQEFQFILFALQSKSFSGI